MKILMSKYDWLCHLLGAYVTFGISVLLISRFTVYYYNCAFWATIYAWVFVEFTQIDIYGIKGRWTDTGKDLVFDAIGLCFSILTPWECLI